MASAGIRKTLAGQHGAPELAPDPDRFTHHHNTTPPDDPGR
jgi:hypothetical protein